MIRPYIYLAAAIALLIALSSGAAYLHHRGYLAGRAEVQAKLDGANRDLGAAVAQSKADDAAVVEVRAELEANAREQARVDAQAAQAVNAARAQAADADRTLKAWMGAYAKALRDPDCQKASVLVCEPLRGY